MRSSFPLPPIPVDSIVINELPSQKPTATLLHSSNLKHQHHLYNYWTLNERLRSKNEKLSKRQQSSCRLAFYALWLFIFAGIMAIIVYRFTDDCPLATIDRKQIISRCLRHVLFLSALFISFLACSGVIFGTCRYFRSQPRPLLYNDEYELHLTQNYDTLPVNHATHRCCCHTSLENGASRLPSPPTTNHNDEHSNVTVSSSIQNLSPQRKVPPFTYDELPPTRSLSPPPLPPFPILPNVNVNSKSSNAHHNKSAFFSSSTSTSSSPQSIFSTKNISNSLKATTSQNNNNKHKRKSTLTFEDACPSTPTSYTTCVCGTDVWERQPKPSIPSSLR